jgi:hypothetical protein
VEYPRKNAGGVNAGLAVGHQHTRTVKTRGVLFMNMHLSIGPLVSLIAGILILMVPRLLNYIVAIYLIVIGLLGLFGSGNLHL